MKFTDRAVDIVEGGGVGMTPAPARPQASGGGAIPVGGSPKKMLPGQI
jgi:hypothetical protein